jgi:hypothetical protein
MFYPPAFRRSSFLSPGLALAGVIGLLLGAPLGRVAPARASDSCTVYVSPAGSAANSGASQDRPTTLDASVGKTIPGSVVCIGAGTYNRSKTLTLGRSGTASAWITYRSYNGEVTLTGNFAGNVVYVPAGVSFVEVNGLTVNGNNVSLAGIKCGGGQHVRFVGNRVLNSGTGGITSNGCDYVQIERNLVYHTGYGAGWSSGIGVNTPVWADQGEGFHNVIAWNIVSGSFDNSSYRTDGNGIILDRESNQPPALVINNLVYENGGRCIESKQQANAWFVNNTCYANGLDTFRSFPSFLAQDSQSVHLINNIAYGWNQRPTYKQGGTDANTTAGMTYRSNLGYFSDTSYVPSSIIDDPVEYRDADPRFSSPLPLDPSAGGQYAKALAPWLVGDSFTLLPDSPAIDAGVDPRTVPGITGALADGLTAYLQSDLAGNPRVQGDSIDIGAYEAG